MGRKRRIAANLALVLAGVAIAFLIAEAAVRVSGLAKVSLYTWDAYRGWGLKPGASGWQREEGAGFVRVNRAGFRGPEWTIAKPPDTLRVAVVGDSFTEAPQVAYEQTFCAVAEHALGGCKGLGGRKVQMMDFGTDAYGTAQELITLRRHAWQYSPDIVVLAFFSGNDLRNNSTVLESDKCRPFYVYEGGQLMLGGPFERSRWFYLTCMMRFESRHSQVLNLIGDAKSDIRSKMKAREAARRRSAPAPKPAARVIQGGFMPVAEQQPAPLGHEAGLHEAGLHEEGLHEEGLHEEGLHEEGLHEEGLHEEGLHEEGLHEEGLHEEGLHEEGLHEEGLHEEGLHEEGLHEEGLHEEGLEDNIYNPPTTPVWRDAWRVTEGIITMMARETAAHHVPLLVVTLANPPQIYPSPAVRGYYLMTYRSSDIFYPDERIKALGEREGFEVLNLAPPMQAYADEHHVFLAGFKDTKLGVGHWNAAGHRLAGELIAQKICEMLSGGTHPAAAAR